MEVAVERAINVLPEVRVDTDVAVGVDGNEILAEFDNEVEAGSIADVGRGLEVGAEVELSEMRAAYSKRTSIDSATFSFVAQGFPPG